MVAKKFNEENIDNDQTKEQADSINLTGERIFKFLECHTYLFKFNNMERKHFLQLYSITSEQKLDRALGNGDVFVVISNVRAMLWSKLS